MNQEPILIPQDDDLEPLAVPARDLRNALRLLFWGILLIVIDIRYSDFDVQLNTNVTLHLDNFYHVAGAALILWGLSILLKLKINKAYYISMMYCFCISISLTIKTLSELISFPPITALSIVSRILVFAYVVAVLSFCFSMRQLSVHYNFITSEEKWTSCLKQFVLSYAILIISLLIFPTINLITNGEFKLSTTGSLKYLFLGILIPLGVYIFFLHIYFMLCLLNTSSELLVRAKKEELGIQGDWKV